MRKTWIMIAAAGVVLLALIAGQLLMTQQDREPDTGSGPRGEEVTESSVPTIPPLPSYQKSLSPIRPRGPLKAGDPLPPLTASPSGLVSAFKSTVIPEGTTFEIIFRPWGLGPVHQFGRTVAVSIYSAESSSGRATLLAKRTVLLVMRSRRGGTVNRGGTYRGTVTFIQTENGSVPVLSQVALTSQ